MKLYEFAIIYTPVQSKDQHERGEKPVSELIVDVTRVLAESDKEATMLAARAIPSEYASKLSQVEVVVRPF